MSEIYGLEEVLKDLDMTSEQIDKAMDNIADEVATEILDKAVANVNGPNLRSKKTRQRHDFVKGLLLLSAGTNFQAVKTALNQSYPVTVRTGNLKRSLKLKKLGKNRRKVFADMNIANYACWVHDGTSKMRERPFLDDAVEDVMDTKKYLDVAGKIIDDILDK